MSTIDAERLSEVIREIEPLSEEKQLKKEGLLKYMLANKLTSHQTDSMSFKVVNVRPKVPMNLKNISEWLADRDDAEAVMDHLKKKQKAAMEEEEEEPKLRMTKRKRDA